MIRQALPLTGATLLLFLLQGCVGGLLGGGKPDRLYRLAALEPATAPGPNRPRPRILLLPTPVAAPEIAGDRIFTTGGLGAAYLKDSRWVSPVPSLLEAALTASFATRTSDVAIAGQRGAVGHVLRVVITKFEADYRNGEDAPPIAVIAGEATLTELASNRPLASYRISERVPASENRVAAIVAALDAAAGRGVAGTVDWADSILRSRPPDCALSKGTVTCQ